MQRIVEMVNEKGSDSERSFPGVEIQTELLSIMLQDEIKKTELKEREINELEKMLASTLEKLQEEKIYNQELEAQFKDMQMSATWQIQNKFHQKIIERLLKQGTRRRASYDQIIKNIRILINEGGRAFCNSVKECVLNNKYIPIKTVRSYEENIENMWRDRLLLKQKATLEFKATECPLPIVVGFNVIRFHVREGAESPCSFPELKNEDSRRLSVAIKNIMIMSKGYRIPFVMGNNCYDAEYLNEEEIKWISNDATILVHSEESTSAMLSFRLLSFYRPRTLELYLKASANREANTASNIRFVPLTEINSKIDREIIGREITSIIYHIGTEFF
ncbi:MAG: hypothetical protein NTU95_04100 [Methanothrix sp.]|nr:hypothetical protein [Methanothrix sp.]